MSFWLFFLHGCELPASVFYERESCGSFGSMTLAGFSLNRTQDSSERLLIA